MFWNSRLTMIVTLNSENVGDKFRCKLEIYARKKPSNEMKTLGTSTLLRQRFKKRETLSSLPLVVCCFWLLCISWILINKVYFMRKKMNDIHFGSKEWVDKCHFPVKVFGDPFFINIPALIIVIKLLTSLTVLFYRPISDQDFQLLATGSLCLEDVLSSRSCFDLIVNNSCKYQIHSGTSSPFDWPLGH